MSNFGGSSSFWEIPRLALGAVVRLMARMSMKLRWVLLAYFASRALSVLIFMYLEDWNPLDAWWWSGVASLTIGYGDFFPETAAGKIIAELFQLFWIFYCGLAIAAHMVKLLVKEFHVFTHLEQEWLFTAVTRCYHMLHHITTAQLAMAQKAGVYVPQPPYGGELPPQPSDLEDGEELVDEFDDDARSRVPSGQ